MVIEVEVIRLRKSSENDKSPMLLFSVLSTGSLLDEGEWSFFASSLEATGPKSSTAIRIPSSSDTGHHHRPPFLSLLQQEGHSH